MSRVLQSFAFRIICLALPLVLASALPAAEFVCTTNADGTLCVTQYSGAGGDVDIPTELGGQPVTRIGAAAFYGCTGLRSVRIPASVTAIQNGTGGWHPSGAFAECTNLTRVTFGTGITNIGDYAFFTCSGLKTVQVPDSVVRIGIAAFANCSALESATLGDNVARICRSAFEMGYHAYRHGYASSLAHVELGKDLTSIGPWAFQGCTALREVSVPDHVRTVGHGAFRRCNSLARVSLGKAVTELGRYVFSQCTSLQDVRFSGPAPAYGRHLFFRVPDARIYRPRDTTGWEGVFGGCAVSVDKTQ